MRHVQHAERLAWEERSGEEEELLVAARSRSPKRVRKGASELKRKGTRTTVRLDVLVQQTSRLRMAAWDAAAQMERSCAQRERLDMSRNDWLVATAHLERRLHWHENARDWVSAEGRCRLSALEEPWPPWLLRLGEPL